MAPEEREAAHVGLLRRASDVAWRSLVIAAAVLALAYAFGRLRFVLLPLIIALLLTTVLAPVARWLEGRGLPTLAATWAVFLGFIGVLVVAGLLIVPAMVDEFSQLGPTVSKGVDDVEEWLIEGPLELEQAQIDDYRAQARQRLSDFAGSAGGEGVTGAVAVVEGFAGGLLALVLTFFFVKDGRRFQRWALSHVRREREDLAAALGRGAWHALGGYLRGAALIGVLEAVILGLTVWLVGASLAVPVAVLTFVGAFFPIVGAVVAGIVAALVALVSGGLTDALVVGGVALAVQQFDNDLLAPMIYGRAIKLHPAVVLVSLAAGGTLAGIMGAFLAVPVAAVVGSVLRELWARHGEEWRAGSPAPG